MLSSMSTAVGRTAGRRRSSSEASEQESRDREEHLAALREEGERFGDEE